MKSLVYIATANMKCYPAPSQVNVKPHTKSQLTQFQLTGIFYVWLSMKKKKNYKAD